MKKILGLLGVILITGCGERKTPTASQVSTSLKGSVYALTLEGLGDVTGSITVSPLEEGIIITIDASNLPSGEHGFHIHETNTLGPSTNESGAITIGGTAKGHWDPDNTGIHTGPMGNGHRGDLYRIVVDQNGFVQSTQTNMRININDILGKAFMIHVNGDNYSDTPAPLGGGGGRLFGSPF